jgi:hypothetical protein
VEEIEPGWQTGKILPVSVHDKYPLNEITIKDDTGINVLIDMAHKCDFFTLWNLGEPPNQRGIRTIGVSLIMISDSILRA